MLYFSTPTTSRHCAVMLPYVTAVTILPLPPSPPSHSYVKLLSHDPGAYTQCWWQIGLVTAVQFMFGPGLNHMYNSVSTPAICSHLALDRPHYSKPPSPAPHCKKKSHLCIPFLGIARPQSQFPHSCVCERFIYSQDRSTYFPAAE